MDDRPDRPRAFMSIAGLLCGVGWAALGSVQVCTRCTRCTRSRIWNGLRTLRGVCSGEMFPDKAVCAPAFAGGIRRGGNDLQSDLAYLITNRLPGATFHTPESPAAYHDSGRAVSAEPSSQEVRRCRASVQGEKCAHTEEFIRSRCSANISSTCCNVAMLMIGIGVLMTGAVRAGR